MWVKQYGLPGITGALLGILLVTWIQPTTTAGVGLVILTAILLLVGLTSILGILRKNRN
jgi:hypothetical protein